MAKQKDPYTKRGGWPGVKPYIEYAEFPARPHKAVDGLETFRDAIKDDATRKTKAPWIPADLHGQGKV